MPRPVHPDLTRRHFLATTLATAGAAYFAPTVGAHASGAQRIVIIGAGLAGLAAGWELTQAGKNVTLLEARTRPGGRVHTLRDPFAEGLYAEAGAMFAGGRHIGRYVEAFGLKLVPPGGPPAVLYRVRGRRILMSRDTPIDWPVDLAPNERGRSVRQLTGMYTGPVLAEIGDSRDPAWPPPAVRKYDGVSYAEFLKSRGASPGAIALIRLSVFDLYGQGIESVSALMFLRDMALYSSGGVSGVFDGGSDQLPEAFARRLGERIQYGCVVRHVRQSATGVRVTVERGDERTTIDADRLICTAPFSVLGEITFEPALPADKRRVVDSLPYSSITRVYLQTRRRFWEDEGASGVAYTDGTVPRVLVHPMAQPTRRGVMETHFGRSTATRLATLDEPARIAFAKEHLAPIHPGITTHAEGGTSYSWVNDPWTRGGYSSPAPGMLVSSIRIGARAEGRVHFAGEHTSPHSASMEGALESGNRVAREVLATVE